MQVAIVPRGSGWWEVQVWRGDRWRFRGRYATHGAAFYRAQQFVTSSAGEQPGRRYKIAA